ncbi:DUF58 domain-containing protein [Streptomyces sp. NPDC046985]|uniref:DUF58 domain-containing protein n=1 Tax=Streptomyces sp. NPDC046985 TaxID=3155377 RepID=UPI0034055AA7
MRAASGLRGVEDAGDARDGVRAALAGLTTRGRSFLAAGVAAAVCAYVLGQPDLLRVGLLLAFLPSACATVLSRTRHRVAGDRLLSPARVPAGGEARVRLRMDNVSRLPTGLLMLEDQVPYVLGPRPRFVLDRVEPGGRREVSYRVRSDLRGRYPLGPLRLRLTDPFGMCELTRSFSAHDTLTVVPRVEPLPPVRLSGAAGGYGEGRQRSLALAGDDDVIPREYRHGDDLRRVHWRSTARYGELMVRREEQPQRPRCTVLLDTRAVAFQGAGPDSAFEWAVSGAASVLAHLLERGFSVRLLTDTGSSAPGEESGGFTGAGQDAADTAGLLMDALAVIDHSDGAGLSRAGDALRDGDGLLVAFLGDLDEAQTAVVARMRRRGGAAVAFVLDSGEWLREPAGASAAQDARERLRLLREAGWTVVRVPRGAALGEVWRQAEREGGSGGVGGSAPAAGAFGAWGAGDGVASAAGVGGATRGGAGLGGHGLGGAGLGQAGRGGAGLGDTGLGGAGLGGAVGGAALGEGRT